MGQAEGFTWHERKNGDVAISHHGTLATVLRGQRARRFLDTVTDVADEADEADDEVGQALMARLTGNYRRGNERAARQHPRHR